MEEYPGAELSISQLLYALEREVDDITSKRRSDDDRILVYPKLTDDLTL